MDSIFCTALKLFLYVVKVVYIFVQCVCFSVCEGKRKRERQRQREIERDCYCKQMFYIKHWLKSIDNLRCQSSSSTCFWAISLSHSVVYFSLLVMNISSDAFISISHLHIKALGLQTCILLDMDLENPNSGLPLCTISILATDLSLPRLRVLYFLQNCFWILTNFLQLWTSVKENISFFTSKDLFGKISIFILQSTY